MNIYQATIGRIPADCRLFRGKALNKMKNNAKAKAGRPLDLDNILAGPIPLDFAGKEDELWKHI